MRTEGGFNIRVYGILINKNDEILLTDEYRLGQMMTKFPGGGLKYGEGTIDCLKREFNEELGQIPEIIEHIYTTDYFQPTFLLKPTMQLISIYYRVSVPFPESIVTTDSVFNIEKIEGSQSFRWLPVKKLTTSELTFPIDKKVSGIIISGSFNQL